MLHANSFFVIPESQFFVFLSSLAVYASNMNLEIFDEITFSLFKQINTSVVRRIAIF